MQGKLSLKINSFHLLEIDCSKNGGPTDDSPWRKLDILLPTGIFNRAAKNEFEESYSVCGLYMPTIIELMKETGIIWGFQVQILGFGIRFYKQVGY